MPLDRRIAAAMMVLGLSGSASAQERANLTVTGGLATDPHGVETSAVRVAPSVTFQPDWNSRLSFDISLTQYRSTSWALGGNGAGEWRRYLATPLALVLNADISALRFNAPSPTTYASGTARPTLELAIQNLALVGGAIVGTGMSSPGAQRSALGTTLGAVFVSSPSDGEMLRLDGRRDHYAIGGVRVTDASVGLVMDTHAGLFAGRIGQRSASDERTGFGDVSVEVAIATGLQFKATAGRYPRNRLTDASEGTFVSAGFVFGSNNSPLRP